MRKGLSASLLLLGLAPASLAGPITVLSTDAVYELAQDGTWTAEVRSVTRVNEQAAVTAVGQAPLAFSESLQQLEVLEAFTTTPGGQRVDVAPGRILTQQHPQSAGAPSFSDYKVRNVVFPRVEVGSTLTLHYRLKQLQPFLPGVFTLGMSYSRFVEFHSATLTVRAPASRALQVHGRDVPGGAVGSATAGMREWRWKHGPTTPDVPEPGAVVTDTISPGVLVSSLADYPALADAYMQGAAPAARVTPAVQQLANRLTTGLDDRRAQAEAIFRWVSGEVRYVAIAMGTGGFVPHDADAVIAAGFGDCKDKSTLLIALLAAKDITAVPALINTAPVFSLPEHPILAAFNHVIAYVPEFDLYLDATIQRAPFDALPGALRARPVLVAAYDGRRASVRETPRVDALRDRTITRTLATLATDGTITGTSHIEAHGATDGPIRSRFALIPEQALQQLGRSVLTSAGNTGDVQATLGDLDDYDQHVMLSVQFTHRGLLPMPGPGAMSHGIGAFGGTGARAFVAATQQLVRNIDFPCPAGGSEESLELTLPAGFRFSRLPEAATVHSEFGVFAATYEVTGGRLLLRQRLDLAPPKVVCTKDDHARLRAFASDIALQLRRQMLYE